MDRMKQKEAEARKRAEARKAEAARMQGAEAGEVQVAEAERQQEAEAEKVKKKKTVIKAKRKLEAESRKRPRSQSPLVRLVRRLEAVPEPLIDLIDDTPEEERVEVQPSPLPAAPEAGPSTSVMESASDVAPPEEPRVEEPREAKPSERAPTPARTEEGDEAEFILRSLADKEKWFERTISQVCVSEIERSLLSQGSSSFFRDAFTAHLWVSI